MIGDIRKFKFWCQKVLPLVYDDSLSYYEVLCKIVQYLNKVIEDVNSIPEYIDAVITERLTDEHIREIIEQLTLDLENAISSNNESSNDNSSADYNIGEMLWWYGKLYKVIRHIDAGDAFIVDTNIELVNFEDLFNNFVDEVKHDISANDDGTSPTATQNWSAGTWLWLDNVLYKVISNITQGNAYVFSGANANVEEITVEDEFHLEETTRANADATLQNNINAEATTRANADTTLQGNITAEATARANADTTLQSNITSEASTRASADTALQNEIGTLSSLRTASKNNLVTAINEVYGMAYKLPRRVIVIADSYGTTGYNPHPFTELLQTELGLSASDYYAYSEGSLGLVQTGSSGHTALTLLQAYENTITSHNTITDVVMTVGLNDYNQTAEDIATAFNTLITYLKSTYPNATIHWAFIGNSYSMTFNAYKNLYACYSSLVNNSGDARWAKNTEYIMHNRLNMQADAVHPNATGSAVLASALAQYLITGSFNYSVTNTATITAGASTGTYTEIIDNNVYNLVFTALYNSAAIQVPASNDVYEFATATNNMITGRGAVSSVTSGFTTDNNYQLPLFLQTFFTGNKLSFKHLTGSAHTINGLQLNNFAINGLTIEG